MTLLSKYIYINDSAVANKMTAVRITQAKAGHEYIVEDATSPDNNPNAMVALMVTIHQPTDYFIKKRITPTLNHIINVIMTDTGGFEFNLMHIRAGVFNVTHPPIPKTSIQIVRTLEDYELDLVKALISKYYEDGK